ncbi:hypothetical protein B9Z55_020974 [Caenorhabditis nigoni]|uniref:Uncharacterized protein n=1 Tax=Caenorhabditis nigoni TaxID=1611254 RepID=A0A2G5TPZ4_9PELO|nr:hypothetical protein B9Z55_020974 [Caenorhabditis nigoni]
MTEPSQTTSVYPATLLNSAALREDEIASQPVLEQPALNNQFDSDLKLNEAKKNWRESCDILCCCCNFFKNCRGSH